MLGGADERESRRKKRHGDHVGEEQRDCSPGSREKDRKNRGPYIAIAGRA